MPGITSNSMILKCFNDWPFSSHSLANSALKRSLSFTFSLITIKIKPTCTHKLIINRDSHKTIQGQPILIKRVCYISHYSRPIIYFTMSHNFSMAIRMFIDDEILPSSFLSFSILFFTQINNLSYDGFMIKL